MAPAATQASPNSSDELDPALVPIRARIEDFSAGGECLLYNPLTDEASALNRTATEIWSLCGRSRSLAAIARELAARYGVDAALLVADVSRVVRELRDRGLLELHVRTTHDGRD